MKRPKPTATYLPRFFLALFASGVIFSCGGCPTPPPGAIGPGGTLTLPSGAPPPVSYPPAWDIAVVPNPLPAINGAGITVTITFVTAAAMPVGSGAVPVTVLIQPGNDLGVGSIMDFGPNPTGPGSLVGTNVTTDTGAGGILSFTLRSTGNGDDVMVITAGPGGGNLRTVTLPYEHVLP